MAGTREHGSSYLPHMETKNVFAPGMDRINRRVSRLRTLLGLGATMENMGNSLHLADMRIDVGNLTDMDEAVWGRVQRSIEERMGTVREQGVK